MVSKEFKENTVKGIFLSKHSENLDIVEKYFDENIFPF